jgi:predicted nucleotidyltransferase
VSSAEEFAGSLRAAAVAIHDAQQHVTASRASASASARHVITAFEGSSNAAAQAAVDGSLKADEEIEAASTLLSYVASELSAYMTDTLGTPSTDPGCSAGRQATDSTAHGEHARNADTAPRTAPQGLTPAQFSWAMETVRRGTAHIGGEVAVHGSRAAGTARPGSDIDFAIRVDEKRFDELIAERFKRPNPGSAKERTMRKAVDTGKIQAGELGVSRVRRQLKAGLGMKVDLSAIRRGGPFDNPPFMGAPQ